MFPLVSEDTVKHFVCFGPFETHSLNSRPNIFKRLCPLQLQVGKKNVVSLFHNYMEDILRKRLQYAMLVEGETNTTDLTNQ